MRILKLILISSLIVTACTPSAPTVLPSPTAGRPLPEPQKIVFETSDNVKLAGFYYPSANPNAPVIVLLHMFGGSHKDWETTGLVQWLLNQSIENPHPDFYPPLPRELSFAVFAIDLRGQGESEGLGFFPKFLLDATAAYEQAAKLTGVDSKRIAGIGASVGADAVVDACTTCRGALSLSPGNFIDAVSHPYRDEVARLDAKNIIVWCLAGQKDQAAVDACKSAQGKHYRSFIYEGNHHGTEMISVNNPPADAGQAIHDWLMETFK